MEDKEKYLNFGECRSLLPKCVGEPGERTFSIQIECQNDYVNLLHEKEQLALIAQNINKYKSYAKPKESPMPIADNSSIKNYKLIDLALEFEENSNVFDFYFVGVDEGDKGIAAMFYYRNDYAQFLAKNSLKIISQGRPICTLCLNPINKDGHFCIKMNGHIENIKIV
ncbi:MAG: DUF3090 family protein [Chloroflexota bacterium]|nr:DUF3090 family protein [Chloroflexota bacterium]